MNTILRDLSIIWTLIHCCVMFMFLYESRYTQRKTNIITAIFIVPLTVVNMLNVTMFGIEKAGYLIVPCCVLPSLIFFFIMAKNRDTRFLFTFCVCDTVTLEVLLVTNLLDCFFGMPNYIVMFLSRLILFPLLEFFLVKYIRKHYHFLQRNMTKGWGVFSCLSALFYCIILWTTYYPSIILDRPKYIPLLIWILILVPVMYITIFKVLWVQVKLYITAAENRALNTQINMVNERLKANEEIESGMKILRHDMKHKMLLLNDYIKTEKYDEAEKYIDSIMKDADKITTKRLCGNHCVNVVLSYYSKIASDKLIRFETNVVLPETIVVDETDLAVVLSNGLENAVNALELCDNKEISVKGFIDANKIYIEIKNPLNNAVMFDGDIPRSKQENHGYGTRSMAAIVTKYDGAYSFTIEDGYFFFRCCM